MPNAWISQLKSTIMNVMSKKSYRLDLLLSDEFMGTLLRPIEIGKAPPIRFLEKAGAMWSAKRESQRIKCLVRLMRIYGTQTALSASLRTFLVMVRRYDCELVMLDLSHLTSEQYKALPRPAANLGLTEMKGTPNILVDYEKASPADLMVYAAVTA